MQRSPDLSVIASSFEQKIKVINDTFRLFSDEWFNDPCEAYDDDSSSFTLRGDVKTKLQSGIQDLYLYTLENYNKLPRNQRVEIKYYFPFTEEIEEMLVSRAIRMVFSFYLDILKDHNLITDPQVIKFGYSVIDNYIVDIN